MPNRACHLARLLCLAALAAGCAPRGTLLRAPVNPRLVTGARHTLAVAPPRDLRPAIEHEGDEPRTTLFLPLIIYWYGERRGNYVSDDYLCSPHAPYELQRLTVDYLRRGGAFARVRAVRPGRPEPRADFRLESAIRHLYGTAYEARKWGFALSKKLVETHTARNTSAIYGNALIDYALYDLRGGKRKLVWKRTVRGTADLPAGERPRYRLGEAAARATRRALTALSQRLALALADYAPADGTDPSTLKARLAERGARLRFVVQRASARRSAIELLTIERGSGRVVDHKIITADVTPIGRPGDWMLSRRRPDLTLMPYGEYALLASSLAGDYDLRRVDEIYHHHFFGKRRPSSAHATR